MEITTIVKYPIPGNTYKHYKGGYYKVILLAPHSESQENMVVYQSLLFGSYYVRPLNMWFEEVHVKTKSDEYTVSRFTEHKGPLE